jgi:amino acid transporter
VIFLTRGQFGSKPSTPMIFGRLKRILVGQPLVNHMAMHQSIPKWKALAVMASDALSSVSYATEAVLIPLAAFSVAALVWSIPIGLAIVLLLAIVTLSYRQTIRAYPGGGGAYIVAKENLGTYPSLVAGASLLIDYVLTVAVSVAAGVENIVVAFPGLSAHPVALGAGIIFVIMVLNLRGVRESSSLFAVPTYLFLFSFFAMIGTGLWRLAMGELPAVAPVVHPEYPIVPTFLVLHAFASGGAVMTGIEAISDRTQAFRQPAVRNAKVTLVWLSVLLGALFLSITALSHVLGLVPQQGKTSISMLSSAVFGDSHWFYLVQASTALILVMAANTAYADFPRLSSLLAKDRYLPRQLASLGDRLVFSNGILGLSAAAIFLLVVFKGDTHKLIPLYTVGVFLSLALSQSGMVLRHLRKRDKRWVRSLCFNALGAVTTSVVLLVIASTKFNEGAWMVVALIPVLVLLFARINAHYKAVGRELSLSEQSPPAALTPIQHTVIVPISGIHRGVVDALRYAISISDDVRACYVEIDSETTERVKAEWTKWAHEVPFVVLKSPYRSVIAPLLEYIDDVEQTTHGDMITIIIPEFVTRKWRYHLLHNQTALLIRAALMFRKGKVVTSVRYHLKNT